MLLFYPYDIVFIYRFDSRDKNFKHGKIRLLNLKIDEYSLIDKIKPIILNVINNSNKVWIVEYDELIISIISMINRNNNYTYQIKIDDINDTDNNEEKYLYDIFIDMINDKDYKYYYEGISVKV